jgi:hypothetical protein
MLLGLLLASPALAVPSVTVGRMTGTYPAAPLSGEFMLVPNTDLQAITGEPASFQSFCIEAHEGVTVGTTYDAVVNDEAILGDGLNLGELPGPDGGDPISPQTAYLYTQFRSGTLAGYNYTQGSGRASSALSLQTAFWYLEGEAGYKDVDMLSPQAQSFVGIADGTDWTTIHDVRVLNLYGGVTGKECYQDMLTLGAVPVPGAVLLGGIGTCLIGWLRRRRAL